MPRSERAGDDRADQCEEEKRGEHDGDDRDDLQHDGDDLTGARPLPDPSVDQPQHQPDRDRHADQEEDDVDEKRNHRKTADLCVRPEKVERPGMRCEAGHR
jgi:hypothetical protein